MDHGNILQADRGKVNLAGKQEGQKAGRRESGNTRFSLFRLPASAFQPSGIPASRHSGL